MKRLKARWILLLIVGVVFLGREYLIATDSQLKVWGEEDIIFLKGEAVFSWGENPARKEFMRENLSPRLLRIPFFEMESIGVGEQIFSDTFEVIHHSEHFWEAEFFEEEKRFFFFGKGWTKTEIVSTYIDFQADFWVLPASSFPDFLPTPNQALLFLGDHKPGKNIRRFAEENELPLVSINDSGGFFFDSLAGIKVRK